MTSLASAHSAPSLVASATAQAFAEAMQLASVFAKSRMVPAHFQGKVEDCFVAIQMAQRMGVDPMMALQNVYVVSGKPGLSGALVISLINNSGKLKGRLKFRVEGQSEGLAVTAYGALPDGDTVEFTATLAMAKAEGWTSNKKYQSMPEVMLRYRAATFLARFNFPEVILGMHSAEEWEDVEAGEGVTAQRAAVAASVAGTALLAARKPDVPPAPTPEPVEASLPVSVRAPSAASTPPRFDMGRTEHVQMVSTCLDALEVGPDDRKRMNKALREFLVARTLLATPEGVEQAVRGFFEMEGYVPPADLPREGEEA